MDIKLNDMLNNVKLENEALNLLKPEGYYRLKIPNEERHYYKNKGYLNNISATELTETKMLYTSSAIEVKKTDIIQLMIPKTFLKRLYDKYKNNENVTKNIIGVLSFSDRPRINDKGIIDISGTPHMQTLSFINHNGELSSNTKEITLPVIYNNSKFVDLDFYVYTKTITSRPNDRYLKYVYLPDWLPRNYPQSHYIDEQNRIYNCGILRKGEDPYGNWQEQQNNLAFKHYIYQSHIRKEK